jgi:site-specific DNA-methyltransferase (adenine-specific)
MRVELNRVHQGHALEVLQQMPDKLVDCVITSPPYWSLRDYKTEPMVWGGVEGCEHEWRKHERYHGAPVYKGKTRWQHKGGDSPLVTPEIYTTGQAGEKRTTITQFCQHCNAWRGSLGLEPTIELYLDHLLSIFDEVGRVMKDGGSLWVNIGDSYSGSGGAGGDYNEGGRKEGQPKFKQNPPINIPAKSLCLIPQRFAISMVDRGWILRNTIIWHKPNPMPSSSDDNFTVDFEYLFFFVKNNKPLYYVNPVRREMRDRRPDKETGEEGVDWVWAERRRSGKTERYKRTLWEGRDYYWEQQFEPQTELSLQRGKYGPSSQRKRLEDDGLPTHEFTNYWPMSGRNKRCVWTIPTEPFPDAHFATFPQKLVETPIHASCPEFVCEKCGRGRVRILEHSPHPDAKYRTDIPHIPRNIGGQQDRPGRFYSEKGGMGKPTVLIKDIGLTDCKCGAGWRPGIVLDPFMGSGTVALVAKRLKRDWVGIELSQEYVEMAEKRIDIIRYAKEHPEYKKEGFFF